MYCSRMHALTRHKYVDPVGHQMLTSCLRLYRRGVNMDDGQLAAVQPHHD